MEIVHTPVMKEEVLSYLIPKNEDAVMIDCTTGEGGHSEAFLERYPRLKVIGLDRDPSIQAKATERLKKFQDRFTPVPCWFNDYLETAGDESADLILFDLGISVFHYVESRRGFSFKSDERLDMRLDPDQRLDAETVVNEYGEKELADLIYQYSEERYSRRIARRIVEERAKGRITTASALADIISSSVPPAYRYGRIHPATRTFQALRIEVNRELDRITPALKQAVRVARPGGLIAVITFHSLEDRQVKWFFREEAKNGVVEILTKHPVVASEDECRVNPPSRSAKLRVVRKVEGKKDGYENKKETGA